VDVTTAVVVLVVVVVVDVGIAVELPVRRLAFLSGTYTVGVTVV
jgi:hypothetical protein